MEGWLLAPGARFKPLRITLPGLDRSLMVGQWALPGGGFPSGLMTARSAMQKICRMDETAFLAGPIASAGAASAGTGQGTSP